MSFFKKFYDRWRGQIEQSESFTKFTKFWDETFTKLFPIFKYFWTILLIWIFFIAAAIDLFPLAGVVLIELNEIAFVLLLIPYIGILAIAVLTYFTYLEKYFSSFIGLDTSLVRSAKGIEFIETRQRWKLHETFVIIVLLSLAVIFYLIGTIPAAFCYSPSDWCYFPNSIPFYWCSVFLIAYASFHIVVRREVFFKLKESWEIYEPESFPLITPKSLFDFVREFIDPHNRIRLETFQKEITGNQEVYRRKGEKEDALLKLFLLLHFKHSKLKVLSEEIKPTVYMGSRLKKGEISFETIAREMEEMIHKENLITTFKGRYGEEFIKAIGDFYGTYFFGIETKEYINSDEMKNPREEISKVKKEISKVKKEEELKQLGKKEEELKEKIQRLSELVNRPFNVTDLMMQRAFSLLPEFFKMIDRIYQGLKEGEIPGKEDYEQIYFDSESTKEIKVDDYCNVMCLLYNLTNEEKKFKVKCVSPEFSPHELEISVSLPAHEIPNYVDYKYKRLRSLHFTSSKDVDHIEILSKILKTSRAVWFKLKPREKDKLSVNTLLIDEKNNAVLNGRSTFIQVKGVFRNKLLKFGATLGSILAALAAMVTFLDGIGVPIVNLFQILFP